MFTTFVINLEKDTERLAFMDAQLQKLKMSYRRQNAFVGAVYSPKRREYNPEQARRKGGRELLPGEIGCALSHAAVLERIVRESIPYALILEDDVELPSTFKSIIEREIRQHNRYHWDYLLFDYVAVGFPFMLQWSKGVVKTFVKTVEEHPVNAIGKLLYACVKGVYILPLSIFEGIRNAYKTNNPGPVRFYRPVYFAGAYLVTLEGAKKLHSLTQPIVYTADQLPNRARILRGLRFRCYAPLTVRQLKKRFGSSILELDGSRL